MSKLLYILGNYFYFNAIKIASLFNTKAKSWILGRLNWETKLTQFIKTNNRENILFHCASLGEFEQAKPLIDLIKRDFPNYNIIISFFSPSGFNVQHNYKDADFVCYLPQNIKANANNFISILNPKLVFWIKYEYWDCFLENFKAQNIPTLLVSAKFTKNQPFFKFYGNYWCKILQNFAIIFVQDENSKKLLESINISNVRISGDTRFDRVLEIAKTKYDNEIITNFINEKSTIIIGSSWIEDDEELCHFANKNTHLKYIIAPHEIGEERLLEIEKLYKNTIRYSQYVTNSNANVLIIDNIGILAYIYRFATICFIGGGFNSKGIHNILEAAVYEKPIIFGPEYKNYNEAIELIELNGAFTVNTVLEFEEVLEELLQDKNLYNESCKICKNYVTVNTGSSYKILQYIYEKRLLTNE